MMDKKLKEAEFSLLMMLIGLPCLLRIYPVNGNIFWLLLAIIDGTSMLYLDESYIVSHFDEISTTSRGQRVRFYIIAIMVGYLLIGFKSFSLMLILLVNDVVISILSALRIFLNKSR